MNFRMDAAILAGILFFAAVTAVSAEVRPETRPVISSQKNISKIRSAGETDSYKIWTVKKGENLFRISCRTKTSIKDLMAVNKLKDENSIYAGMKLKIPAAGSGTASSESGAEAHKKGKKSASDTQRQKKGNFIWPVKTVISCTEDGTDGVKSIGLLIKTLPGAVVRSSASGIVEKTGYIRGYGHVVFIRHENSYCTVYANLDTISVREGQKVSSGAGIGRVEQNRNLHFQLDRCGKPLNPLDHLPEVSRRAL